MRGGELPRNYYSCSDQGSDPEVPASRGGNNGETITQAQRPPAYSKGGEQCGLPKKLDRVRKEGRHNVLKGLIKKMEGSPPLCPQAFGNCRKKQLGEGVGGKCI